MNKKYNITLLLGFFFGYLGLHRFYHKKYFTGLLMLITLGGFFIWWVIDVTLILVYRFKDSEQNPIAYEGEFFQSYANKVVFVALCIWAILYLMRVFS